MLIGPLLSVDALAVDALAVDARLSMLYVDGAVAPCLAIDAFVGLFCGCG